jgi:hypothetical protein
MTFDCRRCEMRSIGCGDCAIAFAETRTVTGRLGAARRGRSVFSPTRGWCARCGLRLRAHGLRPGLLGLFRTPKPRDNSALTPLPQRNRDIVIQELELRE